jgi:signal transduction histidine kinase
MDPHEWATELADSKVLHEISTQLINEDKAGDLYQKIVDAAARIMHSEFASLQMFRPERGYAGQLQLLAFRGFNAAAARFWEIVGVDSASSCGQALRLRKRIVVPDTERCEFMAGTDDLAIYRQTGIHSVQTTPLISRGGKLVGMLSTHWREPHSPSEGDLRFLDILARQAADLIEHRREHDELDAQVRERTAEIAAAHERLRALSLRLMKAQDEERRRVARELHDSAGQLVLAVGCAIEEADRHADDPAAVLQCLEQARSLLEHLAKEVRTTSYLLHPPLLDECGLASAIRWYADGLAKRSGLQIELSLPENLGRLPEDLEITLFRIVQECLSNIHRHSGSPTARISIEREGGMIAMKVEDDGKGIPAGLLNGGMALYSGVGLAGMRERVNYLAGEMIIDSNSKGTRIVITLPLAARDSQQVESASAD